LPDAVKEMWNITADRLNENEQLCRGVKLYKETQKIMEPRSMKGKVYSSRLLKYKYNADELSYTEKDFDNCWAVNNGLGRLVPIHRQELEKAQLPRSLADTHKATAEEIMLYRKYLALSLYI